MAEQVPEGTIPDVLAWVGDDTERARAALYAERSGANRSTLVKQLEPIMNVYEEAPMSDPAVDERDEADETVEEAPGPVQPSGDDLVIDLGDPGVVIGPRNQRTPDVGVPEDNYDAVAAEARDAEEEAPIDAAGVDYFQLASTTTVVVIRVDDTAIKLDAQQATALSRDLRAALANVAY